jgi:hypothetical protein
MSSTTTPAAEPHPVDALMPAVRAALVKAFELGRADAQASILAAVGAHSGRPTIRAERAPGFRTAQIVEAMKDGPKRPSVIAKALGISRANANALIRRAVDQGRIVKLGYASYALPSETAP